MKSLRMSTTITILTALVALAVLDWYMDQRIVVNVCMDKEMVKKLLAQLNDDIDAVQAAVNRCYKESSRARRRRSSEGAAKNSHASLQGGIS